MKNERPEIAQEYERFRGDAVFFDQHFREFQTQYPGHYFAIFGKEVIGHDMDLDILLDKVRGQGLAPGRVFIDCASSDEELRRVWDAVGSLAPLRGRLYSRDPLL